MRDTDFRNDLMTAFRAAGTEEEKTEVVRYFVDRLKHQGYANQQAVRVIVGIFREEEARQSDEWDEGGSKYER